MNLIWMDPAVARRQILLHASQQFTRRRRRPLVPSACRTGGPASSGGRTLRTTCSGWPGEWSSTFAATGDDSLLDERTPYLEAEQPFEPLPAGKHGIGFDPLRSPREDTVYRHCLKAIDLVLDQRMGVHGLPLMGTGDWNDGLDEIGSQGRGESVWLGFFLYYILDRMVGIVEQKEGRGRQEYYLRRLEALKDALEQTWRGDRYLRAIHDDGTEIGVKGSGVWEIDALDGRMGRHVGHQPRSAGGSCSRRPCASWRRRTRSCSDGLRSARTPSPISAGAAFTRRASGRTGCTATASSGWSVRRGSWPSEAGARADGDEARRYLETAYRLWLKISPIPHAVAGEIETYGGQPNKQAADMVTTFDPGRMIWNGYTGAAGWMFRQALEGVLGLRLAGGQIVPPADPGAGGRAGPDRRFARYDGEPPGRPRDPASSRTAHRG